jgi:hypothetical protein
MSSKKNNYALKNLPIIPAKEQCFYEPFIAIDAKCLFFLFHIDRRRGRTNSISYHHQ